MLLSVLLCMLFMLALSSAGCGNRQKERELADNWFRAVDSEDTTAMVALLQKSPGLVTATDANGLTALTRATEKRSLPVVSLLLANGADPNTDPSAASVPPLHEAARADRVDLMKELIRYGADLELKDNYEGQGTALHEAALSGRANAVKFLLESGVDVEGSSSPEQDSPLYWAVVREPQRRQERRRIVRLLLDAGANPRRQPGSVSFKWSPLEHAKHLAEKDPSFDVELIRLLEDGLPAKQNGEENGAGTS